MPRKTTKKSRPIDVAAKETLNWWSKTYVFVNKTKIKTLHGVFIIAFVAGIAATMVWTISNDWHPFSKASEDEAPIYLIEDAENGNTNGWRVVDNTPSGAKVQNVVDPDNPDNRVIFLNGSGTDNMFQKLSEQNTLWNETSRFYLQFKMKFDSFVQFMFQAKTKSGKYRYFSYSTNCLQPRYNSPYISYYLCGYSDGQWHTVVRNLEDDFNNLVPDDELESVRFVFIRGTGYLDDIALYRDFCQDLTESRDYSTGGTTISAGPYSGGIRIESDTCRGNILTEWYCNPHTNLSAGLTNESYQCPYGCEDGACIEEPVCNIGNNCDGLMPGDTFDCGTSTLDIWGGPIVCQCDANCMVNIISTSTPSCVEINDNGEDIYNKGTITYNGQTREEHCNFNDNPPNTHVNEFYCDKDYPLDNNWIPCPSGFICEDGACVVSTSTTPTSIPNVEPGKVSIRMSASSPDRPHILLSGSDDNTVLEFEVLAEEEDIIVDSLIFDVLGNNANNSISRATIYMNNDPKARAEVRNNKITFDLTSSSSPALVQMNTWSTFTVKLDIAGIGYDATDTAVSGADMKLQISGGQTHGVSSNQIIPPENYSASGSIESQVNYVYSSKVTAVKSPIQPTSIIDGENDVMRITLSTSGNERDIAQLKGMTVNWSCTEDVRVGGFNILNGAGQYIASSSTGIVSGSSGSSVLSYINDYITSLGETYTIRMFADNIQMDDSCNIWLDVNGNAGAGDDITWNDGSDSGSDVTWIDLVGSDITKLQNTLEY